MASLQHDPQELKRIYLKTLSVTITLNAPIYMAIACYADEIVSILLGEKWSESSNLLKALAIWGFIRSTGSPVGSLLLAVGKPRLAFRWNICLLFVYLPLIWIGSKQGNFGLAAALLVSALLLVVPSWFFLVRPCCMAGFSEYFKTFVAPIFVSISSGLLSIAISNIYTNPTPKLFFGLIVGSVFYCLLSAAFNKEAFSQIMKSAFIK
jgi:O-antigen/teichoic acid export membrane protein